MSFDPSSHVTNGFFKRGTALSNVAWLVRQTGRRRMPTSLARTRLMAGVVYNISDIFRSAHVVYHKVRDGNGALSSDSGQIVKRAVR